MQNKNAENPAQNFQTLSPGTICHRVNLRVLEQELMALYFKDVKSLIMTFNC